MNLKKKQNRTQAHSFTILLNDEEKQELLSRISELKYSKKREYFIRCIKKQFLYIRLYGEVIFQIKKIGNNINQIARFVNGKIATVDRDLGLLISEQLAEIIQIGKDILEELRKKDDSSE